MDKSNWSIDPEYWATLLAGYVLGDLSPEEQQTIERYLAENPAAQVELAQLEASFAALPLALPQVEPPPELRSRVLNAVSAITPEAAAPESTPVQATPVQATPVQPIQPIQPIQPTVPIAPPTPIETVVRQRRANLAPWISGAIAAGLLAVMGWQNYRLSRQVASLSQEVASFRSGNQIQLAQYQSAVEMLRQPDNRLISLRGTSDQSMGSLLVFRTNKKATLNLQNVPPPPPGQTYRLWALRGEQKIYCTEFKPNEKGEVSIMMPMDEANDADTVAVTIEPKEASTEVPIGTMVMNGAISL